MSQDFQDSRLKKSAGEARASRAIKDRPVRESRELSDNERADAYRQSFYQSHLPDLPQLPGYHLCWLTTTNPRDSIHARLRLGYQLVRAEEVPGWDHAKLTSGEWVGCVGINEMLAAKLPLHLYERYMTISHHEEPLAQEGLIMQEVMKQHDASRGVIGALQMEEGTAELGKGPAPPVFAEEFGET